MDKNFIEQTRNIAAIFDFDGVLFNSHFWNAVAKHYFKHKIKRMQFSVFLITHISLWLAAKLKLVSDEICKMRWGEDLAIAFKGFSREEGLEVFRRIGRDYIIKSLRPDILALVQQHRSKGHTVVVLSGCFHEFLETLKQNIGADYVVGTQLELQNDTHTGRIVKPLCFGANKARLLKDFINQSRLNIDLALSFAYADSIVDTPVLESVGNPVATYPDRKLMDFACRRGWQIHPKPASG